MPQKKTYEITLDNGKVYEIDVDMESPRVPDKPSTLGFGKNLLKSTGRLVGDIAGAVTSPRQTITGLVGLGAGAVEKLIHGEQPEEVHVNALSEFFKNRYGSIDNALKTAYEDPVGLAADVSTVAGGAGAALKGAGAASKAAGLTKAGSAVSQVGRVATAVGDVADPLRIAGRTVGAGVPKGKLRGGAERLYESSLKASLAQKELPKRAAVVDAGLEFGIPVSPGGADKLADLIDNLNDSIAQKITTGAGQGKTVDRLAVSSRLKDTFKAFGEQVAPSNDLKAIRETGKDFVPSGSRHIPIDKAQKMKQGTYVQLRKKYGQMGNASIEAEKALARGLKEEIATAIPEIADLNAAESKLLKLEPVLEHAVARIKNRDLVGIGTPIAGTAVGALTGSKKAGIVGTLIKAVLDDPAVKSRIGIMMNQAAKKNPIKFSRPNALTIASRIRAYQDALTKSGQ